jgi:tetratricopeptide (TPR) repeat protein
VTRAVFALTVLILAAAGGAAAYQAIAQRNYSLLLTRGDAALRDELAVNAIEAYSGAIALRPDSMLAYLRRGQTYERRGERGDLDAAARDFRTAASLDPAATRPLEALGDVCFRLGQYSRAVTAYERCIRLDDRAPGISYKLAVARYRDGDISMAIAALADTLRLDDRLADAHYLLGVCLRDQDRVPDALKALQRAVALSPGLVPAREELADLYSSLNRHTDELDQLQVIASLDRDHIARQVAIGLAHARAGHWDLAVLTLTGALDVSPNEPEIYRALGKVWLERPRDDRAFLSKARQALQRVASSPAATSETLTLYGRALLQEGDVESAEHALHQATLRYPIDPQALTLYASTAEKQAHFESARQALVAYGGLIGNDVDIAPRAARIAALSIRLGDPETAANWLTKAAAASPGDVRLIAALADAQLRAGNRSGAQATIARGLTREPDNASLLLLGRRAQATARN